MRDRMRQACDPALRCVCLALAVLAICPPPCQTSHQNLGKKQQLQLNPLKVQSDDHRHHGQQQQTKLSQLSSQQPQMQQQEPTRMDDIVNQLWDTSNALDLHLHLQQEVDASKNISENSKQETSNFELLGTTSNRSDDKLGALLEVPSINLSPESTSTSEQQDFEDMKKLIGLLLDHHSNQTASQQEEEGDKIKIRAKNVTDIQSSARGSSNLSGQTIARSLNQSSGATSSQMYSRAPYASNYDHHSSPGGQSSGQLYTTFLDKMNNILSIKPGASKQAMNSLQSDSNASLSERIDTGSEQTSINDNNSKQTTINNNKSKSGELGAQKAQAESQTQQIQTDSESSSNSSETNKSTSSLLGNAEQRQQQHHAISNKYAAQFTNDLSPTPAAGHALSSDPIKSASLDNANSIYQDGQSFNNLLSPPSNYASAELLDESATLSSISVPLAYYNQLDDSSNKLKQFGLSNMAAAAVAKHNNSIATNYFSNLRSKHQANSDQSAGKSAPAASNANTSSASQITNKNNNNDAASQLKTTLIAHSHQLSPSSNWQHQQRFQNGSQETLSLGSGQPHYAASLINLTAPMVLPLSASESMEVDSLRLAAEKQRVSSSIPSSTSLVLNAIVGDSHESQDGKRNGAGPLGFDWNHSQQQLAGGANLLENGRSDLSERPAAANLFPSLSPDNSAGSSDAYNLNAKSHNAIRLHFIQNQAASGFRAPPSHTAAPMRSPAPSNNPQGQQMHANSQLFASNPHQHQHQIGNLYANGSNVVGQPSSASDSSWPTTLSPGLTTPSSITRVSSLLSQQLGQPASNFALGDTAGNPTLGDAGTLDEAVFTQHQQQQPNQSLSGGSNKPQKMTHFNLTRVEHISAECSNELIRTVIIFNGTFKGIIYSSGYVGEPSCMYVNGTGKTRYEFSIRLNQCGTHQLATPKMRSPINKDEVRRREQVMFNTLSIQYNPIIEQEWDEHFRVSCEYGTDFWKTISFNPFRVETNTGAPVAFTAQPPACQMEVRKGHNMVGPRQEAISGPVTVGDPLTLLIHMKSEKAGYDILVKNCIAHNGGHQKMALIDSNGCVVNERFISPFRGTFNDNDLKEVTLYAYLKAFRFTGSPVLYLECEIHMCQSACPPQMCYWRRLSKRSANETELDSVEDDESQEFETEKLTFNFTREGAPHSSPSSRTGRSLAASSSSSNNNKRQSISDSVNLSQSLEVRQEHDTEPTLASAASSRTAGASQRRSKSGAKPSDQDDYDAADGDPDDGPSVAQQRAKLLCYKRSELLAYFLSIVSIFLVAIGVTIGCCLRATSKMRELARYDERLARRRQTTATHQVEWQSSIGGANQFLPWFCNKTTATSNSLGSPSPTTCFTQHHLRGNNISKRAAASQQEQQFCANQATNNYQQLRHEQQNNNNLDCNGY